MTDTFNHVAMMDSVMMMPMHMCVSFVSKLASNQAVLYIKIKRLIGWAVFSLRGG